LYVSHALLPRVGSSRCSPGMAQGGGSPVVVDIGSDTCKVGFAGHETPHSVFPSVVGKPAAILSQDSCHVGAHWETEDAIHSGHEGLAVDYPIRSGTVQSWDGIERILQRAFQGELQVNSQSQPILLTEPPLNSDADRERMASLVFETFGAPAMYQEVDAILSLFTSGCTTGTVVTCGHHLMHVVPICEGRPDPHAILKQDLAGHDLNAVLMELLREQGCRFHTMAEHELVRKVKEKLCYVALDFDAELRQTAHSTSAESIYEMPDGGKISLGSQRFRCPEVLFQPLYVAKEGIGIDELTFQSVMKCEAHSRAGLFSRVVLAGGTTLLPGLPERMQKGLGARVPVGTKAKIVTPRGQKYAAWVGGSILASLPTFAKEAISQRDYEEHGPCIARRRRAWEATSQSGAEDAWAPLREGAVLNSWSRPDTHGAPLPSTLPAQGTWLPSAASRAIATAARVRGGALRETVHGEDHRR